jgi:hypothetical protein
MEIQRCVWHGCVPICYRILYQFASRVCIDNCRELIITPSNTVRAFSSAESAIL